MSPTRRVARTLLSGIFVTGGINALRQPGPHAEALKQAGLPDKLPDGLPRDPVVLVRLNGAAQLVGGLALITGRAPRLASLGLAACLVPTTAVGHPFWAEKDKAAKAQQQAQFLKNLGLLGGLLLSAADTGGRESVPHAAGRLAHDAAGSVRSSRRSRRKALAAASSFGHDALVGCDAAVAAATSDTAKSARASAGKAARQAVQAGHDAATSDAVANARKAARDAAVVAVQTAHDAAASDAVANARKAAIASAAKAREALPV